MNSVRITSLRQLALAMGVSYGTAQRWSCEGLKPRSDGTYSVDDAKTFHAPRVLRVRGANEALRIKQRKLLAEAKFVELKLAQARGELVSRDVVRREWSRASLFIKGRFIGLGRELAPTLVNLGPLEIRTRIDGRIYEILREIARSNQWAEKTNGHTTKDVLIHHSQGGTNESRNQ